MKKSFVVGFLSFVILTLFSGAVYAQPVVFIPSSLQCPTTKQGGPVDCAPLVFGSNVTDMVTIIEAIAVEDTANFSILKTGEGVCVVGKNIAPMDGCLVLLTFLANTLGTTETRVGIQFLQTNFGSRSWRGVVRSTVRGTTELPQVRFSTNNISFGDQTIGTSNKQILKMENISPYIVDISGMTVPFGSVFRVTDDSCGSALAANTSCEIPVYFEPINEVEYASTLGVYDDAVGSPQQIQLSGKGIAAGQPDISIDKVYINFGEIALGSDSTETVTLTSSGTVDLTIDSISTLTSPYSQTNDCPINPVTLAPDATCEMNVVFEPTIAGAYEKTITIVDDATDSPQTIYIKGKGVSPNATLTPSTLNFGTQTVGKSSLRQQVTLLNSGTSTLTITEIKTSSTMFELTNECGETLEPKSMCYLFVTFSPTTAGTFSFETLTVASDDPTSPATVFLFGKGITGPDVDIFPSIFDFGNTAAGTTSERQEFTVANTGDGDVSLYSIGVNSDFEEENDCPATLAEEESCVVNAAFTPRSGGNFFGRLSIFDSAEGSPHHANIYGYGTSSHITILPASINFGNQMVGRPSLPKQVRVQNSGNEAFTISSISSTDSVFAQTSDCDGATLAPSAYCTINVIFTPTTAEYLAGRIAINHSAAGSPHYISVTGTGLDPIYPDLDISPDFQDFGEIVIGVESSEVAFTVKNTGLVDVAISSININGEFTQTNDCPATLASDATCTITAKFVPGSAGKFTGNIVIIDNTPDGYQSALLEGTGVSPGNIDISFSTSILDFGSVGVNTESTNTIAVTSAGTDPVMIGDIRMIGSESINFSFSTDCANISLDAGQSCTVDVLFKPTSSGTKIADILFYNDAHDSPQSVIITGTGTSSSGGCSLTQTTGDQSAAPFAMMGASLSK